MPPEVPTTTDPTRDLDDEFADYFGQLLDAIERIADGLAGIADAINRNTDARTRQARDAEPGA